MTALRKLQHHIDDGDWSESRNGSLPSEPTNPPCGWSPITPCRTISGAVARR